MNREILQGKQDVSVQLKKLHCRNCLFIIARYYNTRNEALKATKKPDFVKHGHKDVVQLFLDHSDQSIELNARDDYWWTVFSTACYQRQKTLDK